MNHPSCITLLTDFGTSDAYVGVMKGSILRFAPEATLIDLTHDIAAQDVWEGAFYLWLAVNFFPPGTVHLGVVDPGVGSERRAIAVRTPEWTFVGPDNGLCSLALAQSGCFEGETGTLTNADAVSLTRPEYWLPQVSHTFHGRDVFAPVAGHLASGLSLESLGDSINDVVRLSFPEPTSDRDTTVGMVCHVDHYGNLVSNIFASDVGDRFEVEVGDQVIAGPSRNYQSGDLVALTGSNGLLEVGARNSSAAALLGLRRGSPVHVRKLR